MVSKLFSTLIVCLFFSVAFSQSTIQLPQPQTKGGMPLMEALQKRQSSRTFDGTKHLTNQQISNLLWAAYGFNRSDKRTAPSALNMQEFTLYIFTKDGVYRWEAEKNQLHLVISGDHREKTGKQDFVKHAALNIVYVADFAKMTRYRNDEDKMNMAHVDCGFIGQNVYLWAASNNMSSIFRGYIDKELLHSTLQLNTNQHVLFSQSVGY